MTRIVLASASKARIALLSAAGVDFAAKPPAIDERAVDAPLAAKGATPAEIAMALAEAKALTADVEEGGALVIGADQTLDLDGQRLTKPETPDRAREQLMRLAGRTHALATAVAIVRDGKVEWRHLEIARLTMRPLPAALIDDYVVRVGDQALASVGAYQIEGPGIQLFERIEGDYFAVLGLPLLPLLKRLREEKALA